MAFAAITAVPAMAADVSECDVRGSAQFLAEPWEDNTRTYAQGAIRIAAIDMIEPAGAPFHLLIVSPPTNEIGERQCRIVDRGPGGYGFYALDISAIEASYDPARGLTLYVPAADYPADVSRPEFRTLTVTINQATGRITADYPD
ncbi:hypothetical protein ATO6_05720 [Oceanicola sp. 22II-s10i]|nr:hypothetical protein ATO6_05720 [Oceanicola sp. 22II-s10i]